MTKYVNPTGEGYVGTATVTDYGSRLSVTIVRGAMERIGVGPGEQIRVFPAADRLRIVPETPGLEGGLGPNTTGADGSGPNRKPGQVTVSDVALTHLGVAGDDHVRFYHRDDALVVVPADADPFVEGP